MYLLHQKQPFGAQTYASYILLISALVKYPSIDPNSVDRSIDRCKKTSLNWQSEQRYYLHGANSNYEFILNITRRRYHFFAINIHSKILSIIAGFELGSSLILRTVSWKVTIIILDRPCRCFFWRWSGVHIKYNYIFCTNRWPVNQPTTLFYFARFTRKNQQHYPKIPWVCPPYIRAE